MPNQVQAFLPEHRRAILIQANEKVEADALACGQQKHFADNHNFCAEFPRDAHPGAAAGAFR